MPDKQENSDDKMKVRESRTVTILLDEDDKVHYYQGVTNEMPEVHTTNFGKDGIRKVLLQKKQEIGKVRNPESGKLEDGIIVIIKAKDEAKYKNMVDILDEMNITGIRTYAIVDITQGDLDLLAASETAAAGQTVGG